MSNPTITELAKATQSRLKTISYGRLRSKLHKQGFSEISLYSHVAMHCEENFINPNNMGKDMLELIEGCCRDIFFVKTSNEFSYLRGQFHQLRHGNLDKGEPKSAEQKNKFLCNTCHEVLDGKLRSRQQTTKNTCAACVSATAKAANARKTAEKAKEPKPEPVVNTPRIELEESHYNIPATKKAHPLAIQEEEPMTTTTTTLLPKNSIELSEVIADKDSATVTVNCLPADLHLVLVAIAQVQKE